MSFILDALRKSENERQQSAVPGISDVPAVVHSTRVPKWILGVVAALSAGVIFLGWAWWQSTTVDETGIANVRPTGVLPRGPTESPAMTADSVRNLAREPAASETQTISPPPAAATPPVVEPATPRIVIGAPTMMELLAAGTVLPELTLEFHVFSSTPAQRLVHINSLSYREGDILPEGPRVISITAEGVILDFRGQDFLLAPE